jgi:hypothetical protein
MHQKLLVRFPFRLYSATFPPGKILTEDVIFDQAHACLVGEWEAPLLIRRPRGSRGRDTLRFSSRRRAAARA